MRWPRGNVARTGANTVSSGSGLLQATYASLKLFQVRTNTKEWSGACLRNAGLRGSCRRANGTIRMSNVEELHTDKG